MEDAERIKAIREMATPDDPASLVDYLVVSGATIEVATAALESVRATGFWQNESGENRWGTPKET